MTTVVLFDRHDVGQVTKYSIVMCGLCKEGLIHQSGKILKPFALVDFGDGVSDKLCTACFEKWWRIQRKVM